MLKDKDALAKEPGLEQRLDAARAAAGRTGKLALNDVVTLVRLAGFEVYLAHAVFTTASRHVDGAEVRPARGPAAPRRDQRGRQALPLGDGDRQRGADRHGRPQAAATRGRCTAATSTQTSTPCYGFGCGGYWQLLRRVPAAAATSSPASR